MGNTAQRAWLSWSVVGLLILLCGVLALLQNRWLDELARAEKDRLHQELQNQLNRLSRDFNTELTDACIGLLPAASLVDKLGREKAYSAQYWQWKESHDRVFQRIALAVPQNGSLALFDLNLATAQLSPEDWPVPWAALKDGLLARLTGAGFGPNSLLGDSALIDLPRFGGSGPGNNREPGPPFGREQDWLIVEINDDYVRSVMLPELLHRHLGAAGKLNYEAAVVRRADPSHVVFRLMQVIPSQEAEIVRAPDASVDLFEVNYGALRFRSGNQARGSPPPTLRLESGPGRWRLLVRHQAGSLEDVVSRARWQNLVLSVGILLLILATVVALVRFSRRAQHLAGLQMNFVAGVSHELRTPLAVIRTAAFNLRGKLSTRPDQVERYGALIQNEAEKLGSLVEQILRFSSARAGQVIRDREPIVMEHLIDESIRSSRVADEPGVVIEKHLEPGLPRIFGDELAMRHVVQNLLQNALKYGTEGNHWIGVFAALVHDEKGPVLELRVADRGPGIPLDEQKHIFDAFFRGRRAIQDQVHGTGLGLNLAKEIVEAHGGSIHVKSEPMKGTEFIVRIPAMQRELEDEFAHSTS